MNILKPALLASILLLSGAAFASVTPEGNRHIDVATLLLRKAMDMLVTPLPTPRRKAMGTSTSHDARTASPRPQQPLRGLGNWPLSPENRT
jgi:hypothetical protein